MAGSQGQARNVPPDDFDNVLRSFHEWMHQKGEADRNRRKVFFGPEQYGRKKILCLSQHSPWPFDCPEATSHC